jgi:hypothetical protein
MSTFSFAAFAQRDTTLFKTEADSLQYIESIKQSLNLFLDSVYENKSYFDVNLGIGNGYFAQKNKGIVTETEAQAYYSIGAGYFHKTGLSLNVKSLMTNNANTFTLFQTLLNPAYDYTKGKKWGYGISYTHYFNKDSLNFYTSPLKNELYAYVVYKGGWLQPTLGIDYALGSQKDAQLIPRKRIITRANGTKDTITVFRTNTTNTNVQDISTLFSLQHSFNWDKQKHSFGFTPSLMAIAGTEQYGTNLQSTGVAFGAGGNSYQLYNRTTTSSNTNAYKLQSLSLSLNGDYTRGKFYASPQVLINYNVQDADKSVTAIFNLTLGFTF